MSCLPSFILGDIKAIFVSFTLYLVYLKTCETAIVLYTFFLTSFLTLSQICIFTLHDIRPGQLQRVDKLYKTSLLYLR